MKRLTALALLMCCSGCTLKPAGSGAPSPRAVVGADASSPGGAGAGGAGSTANAIRGAGQVLEDLEDAQVLEVLEDAGQVLEVLDVGPSPECIVDNDCDDPLPPVVCTTGNNLRTVTGFYCGAGGLCGEASANEWCTVGCEDGACL